MLKRPSYEHTYWRLALLFPAIALIVVAQVWMSSASVVRVSTKADALASHHIPALREIGALQAVMNRRLLALNDYYATMESPSQDESNQMEVEFADHLDALELWGPIADDLEKVLVPVMSFSQAEKEFDAEMQRGPSRDWDRLREHLSEGTTHANRAIRQLELWNQGIRDRASEGGKQTLDEIEDLNSIQLAFSFTLAVVAVSLLGILFGRMRDQRKLVYIAHHDELTGLPNRHSLQQASAVDAHAMVREGVTAVMWLGLDRIGLISGTYGHLLGDQLLQAFSARLEGVLEGNDVHAQLFSFERANWVMLINESHGSLNALDTIALIETFTSKPLDVGERELNVTCSIGLTYAHGDYLSLERLLREADSARRAAFSAGGNCHRVYQQEMTKSADVFLSMESKLRSALQNEAFELNYQPKVSAETGEVCCAEALLRWPQDGKYISPAEFIPVAEKTGLIVSIGTWVLQHACNRWVERRRSGEPSLPVAVNVSAQQFQAPDFPGVLRAILADTGMPPEMLELEITEEVANSHPELVVRAMQTLKEIGVTLAIDDFGTGYSSLAYLKRFPVDVLKIDRAFVAQLDDSKQDRAIVAMVIQMAHELGFSVVAEGVETEMQHEILRGMSCDLLQGFLFSKPRSEADHYGLIRQKGINSTSRTAS